MDTPIDRLLVILGMNNTEAAATLKVSRAFLGKIKITGKIPAQRAREWEYLTLGQVTAEEMCPKVFKPSWKERQRKGKA